MRSFAAHSTEAFLALNSGLPVAIRLEHTGRNRKNASGYSHKFYIVGRDQHGQCFVRWGRIGTRGSSQAVSPTEALNRMGSKLDKGYRCASALGSFRRFVEKGTLTRIDGSTAQTYRVRDGRG